MSTTQDKRRERGSSPAYDLLADWFRSCWRAPLLVAGSLAFSILVLPRGFTEMASHGGRPVEIETAIRWYMGITMGLALGAGALIAWPRWSGGMKSTWGALVALFLVLIAVLTLDDTWVWSEQSWIRYPTAVALATAGLASLGIAWLRRTSAMPKREVTFWIALACGFVFLGFDELMEVHERLGDWLENLHASSNLNQDWITLGYAAVGGLALSVYWWFVGRYTPRHEHWLLRGYMTAVAVFAVSQLLDSFDDESLAALEALAIRLASRGHAFPDAWFVLYEPEHLFNSVEEVLECVAATLFLTFTLRMLAQSLPNPAVSPATSTPVPPCVGRGLRTGRWVLAIVVLALVAIGSPAALSGAPYAGAGGPFATALPGTDLAASFDRKLELDNGDLLEVDRRADTLTRTARGGRELGRVQLRQMLRGVRDIAVDAQGRLLLRTRPSRKRSFMPELVWRAGIVGREGDALIF